MRTDPNAKKTDTVRNIGMYWETLVYIGGRYPSHTPSPTVAT